jgi:hypothetical protein
MNPLGPGGLPPTCPPCHKHHHWHHHWHKYKGAIMLLVILLIVLAFLVTCDSGRYTGGHDCKTAPFAMSSSGL